VSGFAAACRRFAVILAVVAIALAVSSLALGIALGSHPWRALSVGFYLGGVVLVVAGFFLGMRGPVRLDSGARGGGFRLAGAEERLRGLNESGALVAVGFALLVFGILSDRRYPLLP
jgi:hypothetical protein